jgi:hypothetical protein
VFYGEGVASPLHEENSRLFEGVPTSSQVISVTKRICDSIRRILNEINVVHSKELACSDLGNSENAYHNINCLAGIRAMYLPNDNRNTAELFCSVSCVSIMRIFYNHFSF